MPDAPLILRTSIGTYPHTLPLKDGSVTSERVRLEHIDFTPANRAFRPMANDLAFDTSELALVTYLLAWAQGRPLVGIPVVLMQQTALGLVFCRADASLSHPGDLTGCTIGVRAYSQTTGVWLRGLLQDHAGVDLASLRWVTVEAAHVDGFDDPPNVCRAAPGKSLLRMLLDREIDAAVGLVPGEDPNIRLLVPNAAEVEEEWVRASGIRPVNHSMVVRRDLAATYPWLRAELARMVAAAKEQAGTGPPDGLTANASAINLLTRYAHEQHIIPRPYAAEELFPSP
jgi:4,5-dihydroxyphthalate decarboxylase